MFFFLILFALLSFAACCPWHCIWPLLPRHIQCCTGRIRGGWGRGVCCFPLIAHNTDVVGTYGWHGAIENTYCRCPNVGRVGTTKGHRAHISFLFPTERHIWSLVAHSRAIFSALLLLPYTIQDYISQVYYKEGRHNIHCRQTPTLPSGAEFFCWPQM